MDLSDRMGGAVHLVFPDEFFCGCFFFVVFVVFLFVRLGGSVHLVFTDEKKGVRSQIGEMDFLSSSDSVYSGHCTLPSDRSAKSFRR